MAFTLATHIILVPLGLLYVLDQKSLLEPEPADNASSAAAPNP